MKMHTSGILLALVGMIVLLPGCGGRHQIVWIYSLDRSQCISVIKQGDYQYIVNGEHESVPDSGYVHLDIRRVYEGGGVHVCWKNAEYEWEVVVERSRIVESRLDTSKYTFSTSLPKDSTGIPTERKFREAGGAVFDFYTMRLSPNQGAIVEIRKDGIWWRL